jgi:hypothetical protein
VENRLLKKKENSTKSKLAHQLEAEATNTPLIGPFDKSSSVFIRDGMALLQSLNAQRFKTFGDLASDFTQSQLCCLSSIGCLIDVFDRYDLELSIKPAERDRRSSLTSSRKVFQVIDCRQIPDWKKFITVDSNKQALLKFLGKSIVIHHEGSQPNRFALNESIYLVGTGNDPMSVTNIFSGGVSSTHKEADTRMLLHAIHADKVFAEFGVKGRIIIKSPYVLVLCVHYFSKLQHTQELWFQTGTVSSTKERRRYIPVHEICSTLSPVFTNILPAAHAVTCCDTTSSLFGIGNRSVFKVLKENPDNFKDLSNLADCDVDVSVTAARRLVIKLHDSRGKIKAKDEN